MCLTAVLLLNLLNHLVRVLRTQTEEGTQPGAPDVDTMSVALFDCTSAYDTTTAEYSAVVREEAARATRTVYASVFFGENYLACGSSSGSLSVFNLDDVLREQRGSGGDTSSPDPSPRPSLVVPDAHRGAVYSVIAFTLQGSEMLCSAGEDGRSVLWRASDLIAAANAKATRSERTVAVTPAGEFKNPQESKARGALGPVPETTALAVDPTRGTLLSAAGDGVCYGWDLGEGRDAPAMRLRGHNDLLHCVVARVGANQAVTGSEDGTARIHDLRSETCSHVIDVWRAKEGKSGGHGSGAWVGCVALDKAENWAAMGCGGGCITMWSFAAGACASRVPTAAPPQALRLTGQHVMAAGAEPAVYRWNLAGEQISRQPCTPKSVFTLDLQPQRSLTAVGGTGGSVDIFSELGTRVTTLRCL